MLVWINAYFLLIKNGMYIFHVIKVICVLCILLNVLYFFRLKRNSRACICNSTVIGVVSSRPFSKTNHWKVPRHKWWKVCVLFSTKSKISLSYWPVFPLFVFCNKLYFARMTWYIRILHFFLILFSYFEFSLCWWVTMYTSDARGIYNDVFILFPLY